jgi:exopolysaccharide biosynthesis polyprenyl glycosylphosphotransferase
MMSSPKKRQIALYAFKLTEVLIAWCALTVAIMASSVATYEVAQFWKAATAHPVLIGMYLCAWHVILLVRGMYASHRLEEGGSELWDMLGCVSILVGVTAVGAILVAPEWAQASFILTLWGTLALAMCLERSVLRDFLHKLHYRGRNIRNALIIGSGERATRLAETLHLRQDLGYRLVGCIDDMRPSDAALLPWLGSMSELSQVLSQSVVDEVFIALPMRSSYEQIQEAVLRCEEQGALVTMPTDFFSARLARTRTGFLDSQPVLYLSAVPENDWRIGVKRFIDYFGALSLVILFAPVLLGVALAVRLTSKGPVIFKQTRVGLNKRPFTLYKFRTMVQDAELRQAALEAHNEASGPVFKIKKDPRITSIGSFLRKTSLDELPQLLNVLKGEMSLVGPRPLPNRDVAGFREDWQRRRFSVLPGITCLWQLSGRSNISFEQWMELDLKYIDQWSLLLDFSILLKTARVVIKREGAY